MRISAPSSRWHSTRSGLRITTSPTVWMSPAVTTAGPDFFTTMRLGPSPCILMAMSLMLSRMSVTSSRTPGIEENSCSTPSMCTDCTLAPCSDERRMRRSALPSVRPKPRSSGSATTTAERFGSAPAVTCSLFGLISSCQFFWIVTSITILLGGAVPRAHSHSARGKISGDGRPGAGPPDAISDAPALARTAAVVRDRRHVADRRDHEAGRLQRAQRRLAARAGSRDLDLERAHAVLLCLLGDVLTGDLRRIGRRLARSLEAHRPGRRPRDGVALRVRDGDHGIVEGGVHMRHARGDVLALAAADAGGFLAHSCFPSRLARRRAWCRELSRSRTAIVIPVLRSMLRSALRRPLLAGDGLGGPLAGARIGVGALAADRKVAAMAQPAIAAEVLQPLDVELNLAPQVALDEVVAVDHLAALQHFLIRQLRHPPLRRQVDLVHDLLRLLGPDAVDVLKRDHHALVGRDVHTSDTGHSRYSLAGARRRFAKISP